jgi:hypothetical protein
MEKRFLLSIRKITSISYIILLWAVGCGLRKKIKRGCCTVNWNFWKNKNSADLVRMRAVMREQEKIWGSLILFCCFTSRLLVLFLLLAKPAYAELCLQLIPLKNILPCRKIRRGRLRTPGFSLVNMLVDNINFTFPASSVFLVQRNEFSGAKVYYLSWISICAHLTFFLSAGLIIDQHISAGIYSILIATHGAWRIFIADIGYAQSFLAPAQ